MSLGGELITTNPESYSNGGTIGGSISFGQIPVGSGVNTLSGSSSLTYTSNILFASGGLWCNGVIGNTPTSGAGTRLMWIPSKAALRAGEVTSTQWDDANIATHTAMFGYNGSATSKYSGGGGYNITVGASQSNWAFCQSNTISGTGQSSFAAGQGCGISNSSYAINLGHSNNINTGYAGKNFGDTCTISNTDFGTVFGYRMTLSGANNSVAMNLSGTNTFTMTDIETLGVFGGKTWHKQHPNFAGSGKFGETAAVTTTNNTITTLWSKTLADNTVYYMRVNIVARRTDSGTENARYTRIYQVYRQGGGGATLGATIVTPWADEQLTMSATITVDVSSNDTRVRITAENGKTIAWDLDVDYSVVSIS